MARNTRFFRKVGTGNYDFTKMQANIEQAVAQVIKNPLIDGRLITGVQVLSTGTRLEHKLGRPVAGYLVVGRDAAAHVYDSLSTQEKPELYLTLTSSATVTVSLWVF